ncbi:MAG: hypothetical protein V7K92_26505 [Nostoc sp.]|uniref:hypothetical protein n=1 Tax=Nostoc sp. TaxID=1180 RepID=UPI002FF203E9
MMDTEHGALAAQGYDPNLKHQLKISSQTSRLYNQSTNNSTFFIMMVSLGVFLFW